jgi:hypothetical protein
MLWERSGSAFHATVEDSSGRVLHRLIVEELPDGTWIGRCGKPVAGPSWDGTASR